MQVDVETREFAERAGFFLRIDVLGDELGVRSGPVPIGESGCHAFQCSAGFHDLPDVFRPDRADPGATRLFKTDQTLSFQGDQGFPDGSAAGLEVFGEGGFGEGGTLGKVAADDLAAQAEMHGGRAVVTRGTRRWLGLG